MNGRRTLVTSVASSSNTPVYQARQIIQKVSETRAASVGRFGSFFKREFASIGIVAVDGLHGYTMGFRLHANSDFKGQG